MTKRMGTLIGFVLAIVASIGYACSPHPSGGGGDDAGATDAGSDVQSLAPIPTVCEDAGDPDVLVQYPIAVTTAFCERIKECCQAFPDAGTFDDDKCTGVFFASGGFLQTYAPYASGAVNTGHLVYDPLAAQRCFDDIAAVQCQDSPAWSWRQVRQDCWSGMNGMLPIDGGCATGFECAPGMYCNSGHCDRIKVLGESCVSQYECTYQQNGLTPSAWCNGSECVAQVPNDAGCGQDRECQSGHCVLEKCESSDPGVNFGLCHYLSYPIP